MGGDLVVTSAPGRGSTFRLSVVVDVVERAAAAGAAQPGKGRRASRSCAPRTILTAAWCMNTILTELGHRVDFVADGEAAVKSAIARRL